MANFRVHVKYAKMVKNLVTDVLITGKCTSCEADLLKVVQFDRFHEFLTKENNPDLISRQLVLEGHICGVK